MSRHEIDIEGLPEGWESVKATYIGVALGRNESASLILEMRRKVRKYGWSKTLDDVLCVSTEIPGLWLAADLCHSRLAKVWQPNIHGKCPVDGEACIVRVRLVNGTELEGSANDFSWSIRGEKGDVTAWQFVRLAEGVEW